MKDEEILPQKICSHCSKQINNFVKFKTRSIDSDKILRMHYISAQAKSNTQLENNIVVESKDNLASSVKSSKSDDVVDYPLLPDDFLGNEFDESSYSPQYVEQEDLSSIPRISTRVRNLKKFKDALENQKEKDVDECKKIIKFQDYIINDSDENLDGKSLPTTIICKICDETVNRRQMEYHLNEHNDIYPYPCTQCKKSFSSPIKLRRHAKRAHTHLQCVCQICGIVCKNREILNKHDKIVHAKKFTCQCEICNQIFSTPDVLKRHMMIHTDIKPFACSVCNATFRTRSNLKAHNRIHTQEKPFKCEICDANFSYHLALRKHVRYHVESGISNKHNEQHEQENWNYEDFEY